MTMQKLKEALRFGAVMALSLSVPPTFLIAAVLVTRKLRDYNTYCDFLILGSALCLGWWILSTIRTAHSFALPLEPAYFCVMTPLLINLLFHSVGVFFGHWL